MKRSMQPKARGGWAVTVRLTSREGDTRVARTPEGGRAASLRALKCEDVAQKRLALVGRAAYTRYVRQQSP
jgi:hypothetical protein